MSSHLRQIQALSKGSPRAPAMSPIGSARKGNQGKSPPRLSARSQSSTLLRPKANGSARELSPARTAPDVEALRAHLAAAQVEMDAHAKKQTALSRALSYVQFIEKGMEKTEEELVTEDKNFKLQQEVNQMERKWRESEDKAAKLEVALREARGQIELLSRRNKLVQMQRNSEADALVEAFKKQSLAFRNFEREVLAKIDVLCARIQDLRGRISKSSVETPKAETFSSIGASYDDEDSSKSFIILSQKLREKEVVIAKKDQENRKLREVQQAQVAMLKKRLTEIYSELQSVKSKPSE